MPDYIDLLITDNDLTLDIAGQPVLTQDIDSITQDIKHLIRESGLLVQIIGQRDQAFVALNLQKLIILIEEDIRLVPGTVDITPQDTGLFFITANTVKYGTVNLTVGV